MSASPVFDRAPRRVYWEVTRSCDLACHHCRAEAMAHACPDELSHDEGFALLERLTAFGAPLPHLILTGGDPLKRDDLWSLIARAQELGFGVSVAPSGTPLLAPGVITRLREAGVEAISLSLDGPDAATHDAFRGVTGCFARTEAGAREAARVGLPVQINTLVSAETLAALPRIHEVVRSVGAKRWSLFFLVSVGRGTALSPISAEECEHLFEWLADLASSGAPVIATTEAPHFRRVLLARAGGARRPAHAHGGGAAHAAGIRDGNGILFISDTGFIRPSGFLEIDAGNVRTDDVVAVYRDSPLFRSLRDADGFGGRCGRCELRATCGGSRARAYCATGDPLAEDPLCTYEPAAQAARPAPLAAIAQTARAG